MTSVDLLPISMCNRPSSDGPRRRRSHFRGKSDLSEDDEANRLSARATRYARLGVYAYAFGDCLVNSLYGVYENAREGFAERYLAMLAAGGSKSYNELLEPFGLDARDPAFWSIGLSVIERMIGELEAMG